MGSLRNLAKILVLSSLVGTLMNFIFFAPSTGDFARPLPEENFGLVEPAESDNLVNAEDIISLFRNSGGEQIEGAALSEKAMAEASRNRVRDWILLGSIFDDSSNIVLWYRTILVQLY